MSPVDEITPLVYDELTLIGQVSKSITDMLADKQINQSIHVDLRQHPSSSLSKHQQRQKALVHYTPSAPIPTPSVGEACICQRRDPLPKKKHTNNINTRRRDYALAACTPPNISRTPRIYHCPLHYYIEEIGCTCRSALQYDSINSTAQGQPFPANRARLVSA